MSLPVLPFDDDRLHEECGVFGVIGVPEAANFVALGLHALQHRGQEAGGIVAYEPVNGFSSARRFGYVRDNFTSPQRDGDAAGRARHRPRPLFDRRLKGAPNPRRPAAVRRVRAWAAPPSPTTAT